jgi:hypothetical protein
VKPELRLPYGLVTDLAFQDSLGGVRMERLRAERSRPVKWLLGFIFVSGVLFALAHNTARGRSGIGWTIIVRICQIALNGGVVAFVLLLALFVAEWVWRAVRAMRSD